MTAKTEWQFGFNCSHYLPTMNKCRINIDQYRKRNDLVEKKLVSTRDMIIYLGLEENEIYRQVDAGEIGVKVKQDGSLLFEIVSAWSWDECPLGDAGGMCMYFIPHNGPKIACLIEKKDMENKHPNLGRIPNLETIEHVETKVLEIIKRRQQSLFT